ncbi:MAG: phosphoribosylaminoimidazolesuccinocarboxamide synthase [Anaerolineales bacterium]|nr:phosphoribosylaminoimidazolesuccinocarboxamide synthase [Anaerolineales bacterium]
MDSKLIQEMLKQPFNNSKLPLNGKRTGKVRDIYPLEGNRLLLVTTDRLSAFDRILGYVPLKGQVLNQLTGWWLSQTSDIVANHMISQPDPNVMLSHEAEPFSVEVIVRGYITGVTKTALWYRYDLGEREIYGHTFPEGLQKNQKLPQAIITPTTKGGLTGHDERLTVDQVSSENHLDKETWSKVQEAALALFARGQEIAEKAGLILVDTKYEFGRLPNGEVAVIDEIHTPDSSRFWLLQSYQECFDTGAEPENYDKEFIRLEYAEQGYRGDGEPPPMPEQLWIKASQRYIELFERLTGEDLIPGEYPVAPRLTANLKQADIL